jgi:hypothetical protein
MRLAARQGLKRKTLKPSGSRISGKPRLSGIAGLAKRLAMPSYGRTREWRSSSRALRKMVAQIAFALEPAFP